MRHIAIIGSGPAGYYTAEAATKQWGDDIRVDVFDRLPVPYGLIRTGVAPDHQTIKAVSLRYEKTALTENVRLVGNIAIGDDISLAELQALYDAVIIATGAPHDRDLHPLLRPVVRSHVDPDAGPLVEVDETTDHQAAALLDLDGVPGAELPLL